MEPLNRDLEEMCNKKSCKVGFKKNIKLLDNANMAHLFTYYFLFNTLFIYHIIKHIEYNNKDLSLKLIFS